MRLFLPPLLFTGLLVLGSFISLKEKDSSLTTIPSPLARYSPLWNNPKYLKCNTAAKTQYLSSTEKEVIYVLNLARMEPVLFANTVVKKYPASHSSSYYESLLSKMLSLKSQSILIPDSLCYEGAKCHAINSGIEGYVGHERSTQECREKWYFNGECCDYGHNGALDIIMSLLLDEGVPSLGHRKICLGGYKKIGVSIQPHSIYGNNAVLDFHY